MRGETFRTFESHLISATRAQLVREHEDGAPDSGDADDDGRVSLAREIRRLHEHCAQGHLSPEVFPADTSIFTGKKSRRTMGSQACNSMPSIPPSAVPAAPTSKI